MKVTRRTFLSTGVGAAVAAFPAYSFGNAAGPSAIRVSLVTGDRPWRLDVAAIFEELGLAVELVPEFAVAKLSPAHSSLLWIASSSYPDPTEISGANLRVIEQFLDAGKGVFIEFASNFPAVRPAGPIHRAGVARLFVAQAETFPDALPEGAILDPHDAVCLPYEETAEARAIVKIAKIAGVERIDATIPPKELIPGVLLGNHGAGKFAVAATSISEFSRRQYAPQAHWTRLLRDLPLRLLPDADRARLLESYFPLRVHTEPRRWVQAGTPVRLVAETVSGAKLSLAAAAHMGWKQTAPGRFEAELAASPKASARYTVTAAKARAVRSSVVEIRVENRGAAYRRTLDNNIRWFEKSGVMLRPDGSLGVAEWISGPDIEGNRIPFGKRQGSSPERADCVFESALAFWLYGKVAASDRHLEHRPQHAFEYHGLSAAGRRRLVLRPLVHARPRRPHLSG